MDELMLMEYLKNKEKGKMDEHEFMNKFREFMDNKYRREMYRRNSGGSGGSSSNSRRHGSEGGYFPMDEMYDDFYMRRHNDMPEEFMDMFEFNRDGSYNRENSYNRRSSGSGSGSRSNSRRESYGEYDKIFEGMGQEEMYEMLRSMKEKKGGNEHFNDSYARYIVSNMYHFENGRKYVGEKFDISKAKEICERYRGMIPQNITHADVYVAINAQYHDYSELYKSWFGENIDQKIIESAIIFWFKDDDYKKGNKLWKYFEEE